MSTVETPAPHVPAAFINNIADEGTKDEAIHWLQRTWNDYRAERAKREVLETEIADLQRDLCKSLRTSANEYARAQEAEQALAWLEKLFEHKWNGVIDSGSRFDWHLRGDWRHYIKDMEGETFAEAVTHAIVKEKA